MIGERNMTDETIDVLILGARLATMDGSVDDELGRIEDGALAISDGKIVWLGPATELPAGFRASAAQVLDAGQAWITPGLVDCHTHVIHGGNRANEFALRLEGASYGDIARSGGGIISTVAATRAASEEDLLAQSLPRIDALIADGVTTLEIKSGYGLDTQAEWCMLRAARRVADLRPVQIRTTFLAAHAIPPEYSDDGDGYIDLICDTMLPGAAELGLCDAVDGFCETIAFSPDQIRRVFDCARTLGLPVKLHAEQLSDMKGAVLAAEFGALSVDHLEYIAQDGIDAMAKSGSVAVILPGAFYYLRETRKPPIEDLLRAGVPMAVATDANPGSSPIYSLLTAMNMACVLFGMTPAQALAGATRYGALALGLSDRGVLRVGLRADLACWNVDDPTDLAYGLNMRPLKWSMLGGKMREL